MTLASPVAQALYDRNRLAELRSRAPEESVNTMIQARHTRT